MSPLCDPVRAFECVCVSTPRQVFQLEDALGPVRGVIVLDADMDVRRSRQGQGKALTPGQQHLLDSAVENFVREKASIVQFFEKIGKVRTINTKKSADDVYTDALPFLE